MFAWDDTRVEELKRWHAQGLSASEIAARMYPGGLTRNAVIGKLSRLGLRRDHVAKNKPRPRRAVKAKVEPVIRLDKPPKLHAEPLPVDPIHEKPTRTVATIERGECRWPIGHPGEPGFGFCGCPAISGLPYCDTHRARAYRSFEPKRANISVPADTSAERAKEGALT